MWVHEKLIYRGKLPKNGGALTICRFKGGGLDKKVGMGLVFGGGLIPQYTLYMVQLKLSSSLRVIQLSTHTTSVI